MIQKESHLLEACRYVVLNPVRAGTVGSPREWKWSSYWATGGMERPHPCLTTDWILQQFGRRRQKAKEEYRKFVGLGVRMESLWREVRGQSILGTEGFSQRFMDHIKGHEAIPEIPKPQRYLTRPSLEQLFSERVLKDLRKRNETVEEAVREYGYSQREVADHLDLHFTSIISRILRGMAIMLKK